MLALAQYATVTDSALANDIVKDEVEATRRLVEHIANYRPEDKTAFSVIVMAANNRSISQAEIAAEFGVSPGTVSRWAAGKSIPPQYSRETIVSRIGELLSQHGA